VAQAAGELDLGRLPSAVLGCERSAGVPPAVLRASGPRRGECGDAAEKPLQGEAAISHTNRNFVIAYVLLVGLPLLGLVGVLRSGRGLSAPFSVDGAWKIEPGTSRPSASPCANFFTSVSNAPLSISQSGKSLVVILSGVKTATGTLDGKIIKAQFAVAAKSGGDKSGEDRSSVAQCGDGGLNLTATLDPMTAPRTLSGTLSVEGCASCAPLEFRAVRQPKSPVGTR
jgi:hypothetical protein